MIPRTLRFRSYVLLPLVGMLSLVARGQSPFADPAFLFQGDLPVIVDLDDDGLMDLVRTEGNEVRWYRNDGSWFQPEGTIATLQSGLTLLKVLDMDGDNDLDLYFGTAIARNMGSGYEEIALLAPANARIADLDGDGDQDILYKTFDPSPTLHFLTNDGQCAFSYDSAPLVTTGGTIVPLFDPFDWDGDGDLDLMAGQGLNGVLCISYTVDGSYGAPFIFIGGSMIDVDPVPVDVNNDGLLDLLGAQYAYIRTSPSTYDIFNYAGFDWRPTYVSNIDCDPEPELIQISGDLRVREYQNGGLSLRTIPFPAGAAPNSRGVRIADLVGSGLDDILYSSLYSDSIFVMENRTVEPVVTLDLPITTLSSDVPVPLEGGVPAGGFYSGPGVFDDVLYPSMVEAGQFTIGYTWVDPFTTCTGTATAAWNSTVGLATPEGGKALPLLWPNPCGDHLHVVLPEGTQGVRIVDATGREQPIKADTGADPKAMRIATTGLSNGLHLLWIMTGTGTIHIPFVRASGTDH